MDFLLNINAARILVAEHNTDRMTETAQLLQAAGYNVQKAYNVGDALFSLENGQFDLAVIDACMKDREQRPLVEQMSDLPGSMVRWLVVAEEGDPAPEALLKYGAVAFLPRAFDRETLLRKVRAALRDEVTAPTSTPAVGDTPQPFPAVPSANAIETQHLLERQLVEQRTLSTLARSLSSVLDLDVLLTQVVEAAVTLSGAEEGLLLLPDDEEKALYIRAAKGIDNKIAQNFRVKTQDTLAGQVFRSGSPILIGDQGWQKVKTEYLVKSLLYVPLTSKGQIIGVLGVNNKKAARTFNEHDKSLLEDLAAHAAIAVENARLYEESVVRTRDLGTLVRAGEAANSTLAIDRVLATIAGQLISALDVDQCYIGEWVPDAKRLDTLAVYYRARWRSADGPALPMAANRAIEEAFSKRQMVRTEPVNAYADHPLTGWMPHRYRAQSAVYIPLYTGDRMIGMVTLVHIHAPAQITAIDAKRDQIQQLAIQTVASLLGSSKTQRQQYLLHSAQQITDLVEADWCEIALWNAARGQFNTVLSYGEAIWSDEAPGLKLEGFPELQRILDEQKAGSGALTPDMQSLAKESYGKALLVVPLIIKGQTAGVVIMTDTLHERQFSRREIELAQALVLQAANALANARLYRDLELSLEKLHLTQSKLVQTARLSAMGELAAAVAHQINNPLTTILGDTEMVLQDLEVGDPNLEPLQAVSRAGKRAHEVVRRLLAMARQHTPDDTVDEIDVNDSIRNTLTLVKGHVEQGSVTLVVDLQDKLPGVAAVRGELEDVWLNLLLNARDAVANRPNSRVGISSKHDAVRKVVRVVVWDNGSGISKDQHDKIFDPFFTTKPIGEGTGLGLHICQQIVEKCKGSITFESEYNEGTRFVITLPVYAGQEAL
ncbi:GAF domain-containing protein [Aggregatilinea lenta]|uniref:GAF domain-containing protein n=1 Tax=Aggregatilinea lenta TaxID=913108 RepID=UPI000E5A2D0B|nr:GAF domain-containing protein [Aggregatilinea lenta]